MKLLPVVSLALLLGTAACGSTASSAPPVAGTSQQAIATEEPGPLRAVGQAFAEVPLAPEQRARIEALFRNTEGRHAQAWKDSTAARKDLLLALADQVQAGTIDKTALAPKLEAAAAPFAKGRDEDRAALVQLHAALTPEQRAAFVDAFHRGMKEKMFHAFGDKAERAGGHDHDRAHVWKELDLTSDQKDKLKDAFRSEMSSKREGFKQHREEGMKAIEAFKSDKFTGEGLFPADAAKAGGRLEMMLHFVEIATPILTPEQRTKAATLLRDRASHASERPDFQH